MKLRFSVYQVEDIRRFADIFVGNALPYELCTLHFKKEHQVTSRLRGICMYKGVWLIK